VNPELQLGFGLNINRKLQLTLSYQGTIGKNPNLTIVSQDCLARVSAIPGENVILLGMALLIDADITK
jgi:hypothetical protein